MNLFLNHADTQGGLYASQEQPELPQRLITVGKLRS